MGCGGSKSTSSASPQFKLEKDPDDLHLEELKFIKLKVPDVDAVFEKAEKPVNTVVGWSNSLIESLHEIKEAVADISGAFKVEVTEGVDGHLVFVHLLKADGTPVTPEDVIPLLAKSEARKADNDFAAALMKLHKAANLSLKEVEGKVVSETPAPEVEAFNKALDAFKAQTSLSVKLSVKPPAAPGSKTVSVHIFRSVYADPDDPKPDMLPVTPLDICSKACAKDLLLAWEAVIHQTRAVASASKGLEVAISIKKNRVSGSSSNADEKKAAALTNAVKGLNVQLFKLQKAALAANGELNLVRCLILIVESLVQKVKKTAGSAKNLLKIAPKFELKEDMSFDFDLGIKVDVPDFKEFPHCLPTAALRAYNIVMEIKEKIMKIISEIEPLKAEVEGLSTEAQGLPNKFPDAATSAGLGMMDAMKAAQNTVANVKMLAMFKTNLETLYAVLKKIADELKKCVDEIKLLGESLM